VVLVLLAVLFLAWIATSIKNRISADGKESGLAREEHHGELAGKSGGLR